MNQMEDNAGLFYIWNGALKDSGEPLGTDPMTGGSAYEVIRVIGGVPLFYQDHIERMKGTFTATGRSLAISDATLKEAVKSVLKANKLEFCNVKLVVFEEDGKQSFLAYISKSHYPSETEVNSGVKTGLLRLERSNPNAKILNRTYKEAVSARMQEGGFFEVILVDNHGRITEGSKSNVFLVSGDRILTAPGEYVLKGITRQYVFEACRKAGYEVVEQFMDADRLGEVDGAFLSGTSIKVLPISEVDGIALNSSTNPVVAGIRKEYDRLLEKYIDENVKIW